MNSYDTFLLDTVLTMTNMVISPDNPAPMKAKACCTIKENTIQLKPQPWTSTLTTKMRTGIVTAWHKILITVL